jgi:hypothetical protein
MNGEIFVQVGITYLELLVWYTQGAPKDKWSSDEFQTTFPASESHSNRR